MGKWKIGFTWMLWAVAAVALTAQDQYDAHKKGFVDEQSITDVLTASGLKGILLVFAGIALGLGAIYLLGALAISAFREGQAGVKKQPDSHSGRHPARYPLSAFHVPRISLDPYGLEGYVPHLSPAERRQPESEPERFDLENDQQRS